VRAKVTIRIEEEVHGELAETNKDRRRRVGVITRES